MAAGLIFREGRLLITQRPPGSHLAGLWEFPGGKREPGEPWEACLRRELHEELGIEAGVDGLYQEIEFEYPGKQVRLRFYRARVLEGEPQPLGCAALRWIGPDGLDAHAFPAADALLLDRLRADRVSWAR